VYKGKELGRQWKQHIKHIYISNLNFTCNMIYSTAQSVPSHMTSHVGFLINFLMLRLLLLVQPLAWTLTDAERDAVLPAPTPLCHHAQVS
jgi:hypothetical protein